MTNLEVIYDALTVIHSRFEGVDGISIYFTERGMVITASWQYTDLEKICTVQYVLSREDFESCIVVEDLEKTILDKIESQHMLWEVGEE